MLIQYDHILNKIPRMKGAMLNDWWAFTRLLAMIKYADEGIGWLFQAR